MSIHDDTLGERRRHEKRPSLQWRCPNGHAGIAFEPPTKCPVGWCGAKLSEQPERR